MIINKFMNKDISDLSKIMSVNTSDLSKFMGLNIPAGGPWVETFTGANGSDPDSTYWDPDTYSNLKIQNNQLHGSVDTLESGKIKSKFYLSGDFDIQVDFDDLSLGSSYASKMNLVMQNLDGTDRATLDCRYQNENIFLSNIKYNGVYYGEEYVSRSHTYGGLRMIRSGTTITLRYKDGVGNWTTLMSEIIGSDDFRVDLVIYSTGGIISGDFDNFTINSGTTV